MARLTYNLSTEELREFLMLSHLSLSEISRRFGLSRSNLMGLLRGLRTVGDEKLAALLVWAGLEVDAAASLHLGPGVHLWQITSIRQMEALDHLPESVLPATLKFDMVIELPHIVNADLKLTHFCSERRFKSDTPPLHLPTAYATGAVSRLAFTIPAAR